MEVLDERWTLLVVRELLAGSTHFNELRRGNPRMSPALLSKRLRTLERVGVVSRTGDAAGRTATASPRAGSSSDRSWSRSARGECAGSASSVPRTSIRTC
ncbi:winged helix-turn-helix transcriptional regulator [Aeromicrobium sp. UC242_57]|uniref:winged helix-turn-helix transcriptional regulator n=1 Tax=Aeromicrobium sp. UC242_57 TaxID=3374624 RepID=UPI0037BF894B